ncbi:MAG: putative MscS family protein YkuT [Candidatus Heimdallarchaeota archaeon LC_3]|nr:MAG: putative MscS family protein YkuT [Candidatus Heimdallarchaeota archaeon LC_3]
MQDLSEELNKLLDYLNKIGNENKEIVDTLLIFFTYLLLLIISLRILNLIMNKYKSKLTKSTYQTLKTFARMLIVLLFGIGFLNQFEQFSGSLIGFSALLGTAIGFASTQTVGNMISGIYIMIARPFFISDYIMLPKLGFEGIVKEITINYTKILQPNGNTAIISNRSLIDTPLVNTRFELQEEQKWSSFFDKIKSQKKIAYIYPIKFSVSVGEKQKLVNQAVKRLENHFEAENIVLDMKWRIMSRSRLEVAYQIDIMVENPSEIFKIMSNALNQLEIYLEETLIEN